MDYEKVVSPPDHQEGFRLERMHRLLNLLGSPGKGKKFIQVAGTKGKGSVCAILSSVLEAADRRVGMFTSPHLVSVRERIQFNGSPVEEKDFVHLVRRLRPAVDKLEESGEEKPTFFEAILAMALLYFDQQQAEVSILEVGLGGRLDATSVISPLIAVITSISRDHTAILGETLEEIAGEKAGIIKEEALVVSSPQQPEVREVLLQTARSRRAILFLGNEDFFFKGQAYLPTSTRFDYFGLSHTWEGLEVSLAGPHQVENAATALAVLECLDELWGVRVKGEVVRRGLRNVCWPGRMEVASWHPLVVLDGAHNPHSAEALRNALREVFAGLELVLVFGSGQDKEYRKMAEILWPTAGTVIATQSNHPRALEAARLAEECGELANRLLVIPDYRKAFQEALSLADRDSLVCVSGSLFLVADIKTELGGMPLSLHRRGEEQLPLFSPPAVP